MPSNPSGPPVNPFPCGGVNQPACPPEPAIISDQQRLYTLTEMHAHGWNCYRKGRADERMTPHAGDDGPK